MNWTQLHPLKREPTVRSSESNASTGDIQLMPIRAVQQQQNQRPYSKKQVAQQREQVG